jgi:hypothetical protein
MEYNSKLILYLTVWMVAAGIVFFKHLKKNFIGAGLGLTYLINFWLLHWVASALYILPDYSFYDPADVLAGLEQSVYAVVAFGAGYLIFSQALARPPAISNAAAATQQPARTQPALRGEAPPVSDARLTNIFIGIGAVCIFLSLTPIGSLPTITAVVTAASNLAVIGLILKAWRAWQNENWKSFRLLVSLAAAYPLLTIVTQGFIGFGIFNTILVATFVAGFYRPKWKLVLIGFAAGYLGLSVYVTYMRDRSVIRDSVWGGESYGSRFDRLKETFSEFELLSINDEKHLERIDMRLNQNSLVGAAVHYLESGHVKFANGETLWQAMIAVVPRAIWPNKPVVAGSGDLVSQYTGYYFAEGTSVGVGQVMEFYINFGQVGVIIGFLFIGGIIALIDRRAGECLLKDDWINFACWYLPGAAVMQVGGSLVEVSASVGASVGVSRLVKYFLLRKRKVNAKKQGIRIINLGSQSNP